MNAQAVDDGYKRDSSKGGMRAESGRRSVATIVFSERVRCVVRWTIWPKGSRTRAPRPKWIGPPGHDVPPAELLANRYARLWTARGTR